MIHYAAWAGYYDFGVIRYGPLCYIQPPNPDIGGSYSIMSRYDANPSRSQENRPNPMKTCSFLYFFDATNLKIAYAPLCFLGDILCFWGIYYAPLCFFGV
jgi:hypothetical protein